VIPSHTGSGLRTALRRHRLAFLLPFALVALATEIAFGVTNGRGLDWDFANFYDVGHKVSAGEVENLYDKFALIDGNAPQGNMGFKGTPLSAAFYTPLASFSPIVALVLFKVQNTLATLAAVLLLFWQFKRFGEASFGSQAAFLSVFLTFVAVYQPFWRIYEIGGQATPTVFLLLVLALICHIKGRDFLVALFFALAVTMKPAIVLGLAILVLLSGRKLLVYTIGVGAILAATSIIWMGWGVHEAFLKYVSSEQAVTWTGNSSLTVALDNLRVLLRPGPEPLPFVVMSAMIRLGVSGLLIGLFLRYRSRISSEPARRHLDFVLSITACLLLLPIVWGHYLSLLFIPLSYCLAVSTALPRTARWLLGGILVAALAQNVRVVDQLQTVIFVNTWPEMLAFSLLKTVPLGLTALLLMRYRKEFVQTYASPEWGPRTPAAVTA
jgi:hypothetical protein